MTKKDRNDELKWLLQTDWREQHIPNLGTEPWITVYLDKITENENLGIFSALIPTENVETSLNSFSWEMDPYKGYPSCSIYHTTQKDEKIVYCRFGNSDRIEPFIIHRDFGGLRHSYNEIIEEFRHYHKLYHDFETNNLLKFSDGGNETVVAKISTERVEVRLKEVRQFLAVKEMHLAIYFDFKRYSAFVPNDLPIEIKHQKDLVSYSFIVYQDNFLSVDNKCYSYLIGKKLIEPLPIEKCGIWPYTEQRKEKKYQKFIIGVDQDEESIEYVCNPDQLANWFDANPDAPNYLAPVFFKREVLTKYFANPELYSVEDGLLRCQSLWAMRIDNNHSDYIIVFLGDLSKLPSDEQFYWRSYNVPPDGKLSRVSFRRNFLVQPSEPEQIDLVFKTKFEQFEKSWESLFGWPLFLPLSDADRHHYDTLRIPLTNSQKEFDDQILSLTKILIDSLNEKKLNQEIPKVDPPLKGGISKFEEFLKIKSFPEYEKHIKFLRNLQEFRSKSVAHRKSRKNYDRTASIFGLTENNRIQVFQNILTEATKLFSDLEEYFLDRNP